MSHGVEKSTYVESDEITTKALTYDMLDNLYKKIEEVIDCHKDHKVVCEAKFTKIEGRKRRDTKVAAITGAVGGFMAMVVYYIKGWLVD